MIFFRAATSQLYTSLEVSLKKLGFDVQRNFKDPFVNDGLLEVICFRDAWHGNDFLPSKERGQCLAQVS